MCQTRLWFTFYSSPSVKTHWTKLKYNLSREMTDSCSSVHHLSVQKKTNYHRFRVPIEHLTHVHGTQCEAQHGIGVGHTELPGFFPSLRTEQGFPQALVGVTECLGKVPGESFHGLPHQVVVENSVERGKRRQRRTKIGLSGGKCLRYELRPGVCKGFLVL